MEFTEFYSFSKAFEIARHKGNRIYRKGWNGKGMFVFSVPENKYPAARNTNNTLIGLFEDDLVPYGAYLAIKTADDTVVPWLPSQSDLYATDWVVAEEEEEETSGIVDIVAKLKEFLVSERATEDSTNSLRGILIELPCSGDECGICRDDDEDACEYEDGDENKPDVACPIPSSFNETGENIALPDSVSIDFINGAIKKVRYKHLKKSSMVECRIYLHNSYVSYGTVVANSTLSTVENNQRAYRVAFDKLWELYGYVLSSLTYCIRENLDPTLTLFGIDTIELVDHSKFLFPIPNKLTHCSVILNSGFVITGESSCVNPDNFDASLGKGIAYDNALAHLDTLHDFLQIDLAHYYRTL